MEKNFSLVFTNLLGVCQATEEIPDDLGVEQPQLVAESSPGVPGPLLGFRPRAHFRDDALVPRELLRHPDPLGGSGGRQISQVLRLLSKIF